MKQFKILFTIITILIIAGCTATGDVQKAYQPEEGDKFTYNIKNSEIASEQAISILKNRLDTQFTEKSILASSSDLNKKEVHIVFNNYRMRHGASRALVGIFAGADNINTSIIIKREDEILGEFDVNSSNASAWGTSRGLIEGHADKSIKYLVK